MEKGADPNIPNTLGQVPLHSASESGQYLIAELLLQHKADPDFQSINGDSALHYASGKGDFSIVKLLLEYNAQPNLVNSVRNIQLGRTPLHLAVQGSSIDCVKLLREYGADLEIADNKQKRPQDLAMDFRLSEALHDYKAVYLTSKSEDISDIENNPQMYELFNTFGGNLQSVLKESRRSEKPALMEWLTGINLHELYAVLVDSGYDDHTVMARQMITSMPVTDENLKDIGIQKPGTRKKLLFYLEEEAKKRGSKVRESTGSFRDLLESIGLSDLSEKFALAGYDDFYPAVKMASSKWNISEKTLRDEIGLTDEGVIQKILKKIQSDHLTRKSDGLLFYEEPKTVACSRCCIF